MIHVLNPKKIRSLQDRTTQRRHSIKMHRASLHLDVQRKIFNTARKRLVQTQSKSL